jgi:hypothetical protein
MDTMFRSLRIKHPEKLVPDSAVITAEQLNRDPSIPITFRQINNLPENARKRVYRALLPPALMAQFRIDPITWKGTDGDRHVQLSDGRDLGSLAIAVRKNAADPDDILRLEFSDNALNGVDLNLILINNPESPRFAIDQDEYGQPTLFGTARRNLSEEQKAMQAGLAPGQSRAGLRASRQVLAQIESFLGTLGHRAYFLEPLTYASAWVFEGLGFAYVRGHKLMDEIHAEFQPGGRLHTALDNSSPFRQPGQWRTVRGRAWAIHDGLLEAIDARWDGLRMVKQIGRHSGVETFPDATY